jgi:pSer/pThr/pTyr-binding forkhead associated (FHA) protein
MILAKSLGSKQLILYTINGLQERRGTGMNRDLHRSTVRLPSDDARGTVENPGYLVSRSDSGEDAFRLDRCIMIIGCDETAEIRIEGRDIAAYHVELTYDNGQYSIQHCDGREPVKVNGKSVTGHTLADGDVIAVGDHWFTFKHRTEDETDA